MLLKKSGEISPENEEMEPKQKQHPLVDVTGDGSKVRRCKEQYRIGTWKVRSMIQGKFEVVKQEMARVNIDILGISERKWTGMDEFNSDDHFIYYCGDTKGTFHAKMGSIKDKNGMDLTKAEDIKKRW